MNRMFRGRLRPSPSLIVAFVALLVALGGTSYAALKLPAKSVGTTQLKTDAVTSPKVSRNTLTGDDIREVTLGKVPAAGLADTATTATTAAGLQKLVYKAKVGIVPAAKPPLTDPTDPPIPSFQTETAFCDPGQLAVGGGVRIDDREASSILDSFPAAGGTGWSATVDNDDLAATRGFTVTAVCVPASAAG